MPYLSACLDSILQQSETNWELWAIDDHSTDESYRVLQEYALKDKRVQVRTNNGHGIIQALRLAYSCSTGALISRMDADDLMPPKKLTLLKEGLLAKGPGHLSIGLVEYFSVDELGNGYINYQNWLNNLSLREKNYSDIYKECVIPSPCWMVFRADLDDCGAFHPDFYPEDYDLCFRFYQKALKVICIPQILHLWRDHASRTSRNDPNYADIHFFELKIKYFLQLDYIKDKSLILWGAGKKGKKLAKLLNDYKVPFHWITDNSRKMGKHIYNTKIESTEIVKYDASQQLIIAIAAPNDLASITQKLENAQLSKSSDYFVFC